MSIFRTYAILAVFNLQPKRVNFDKLIELNQQLANFEVCLVDTRNSSTLIFEKRWEVIQLSLKLELGEVKRNVSSSRNTKNNINLRDAYLR